MRNIWTKYLKLRYISLQPPTQVFIVKYWKAVEILISERYYIMINKIVIHFTDGKIMKGTTADFFPNKDIFHISNMDNNKIYEINLNSLKAIFFVKSFEGDSLYQEKLNIERVGLGKRIRVRFKDDETLVGYTQGYSLDRVGFIFFPADPDSNNEKAFIINAATDDVHFI